MKAPYVIYADCESIIEKYDTCIPSTDKSSTTKTEIHKPCGFSFVAVRSDGKVEKTFLHRGENCVQEFLKALLSTELILSMKLRNKAKLLMTDEDWKTYHRATDCHICHKSLYKYNEKKRDRLLAS